MDISSVDLRSAAREAESRARVRRLVAAWDAARALAAASGVGNDASGGGAGGGAGPALASSPVSLEGSVMLAPLQPLSPLLGVSSSSSSGGVGGVIRKSRSESITLLEEVPEAPLWATLPLLARVLYSWPRELFRGDCLLAGAWRKQNRGGEAPLWAALPLLARARTLHGGSISSGGHFLFAYWDLRSL